MYTLISPSTFKAIAKEINYLKFHKFGQRLCLISPVATSTSTRSGARFVNTAAVRPTTLSSPLYFRRITEFKLFRPITVQKTKETRENKQITSDIKSISSKQCNYLPNYFSLTNFVNITNMHIPSGQFVWWKHNMSISFAHYKKC